MVNSKGLIYPTLDGTLRPVAEIGTTTFKSPNDCEYQTVIPKQDKIQVRIDLSDGPVAIVSVPLGNTTLETF